MKLSILLLAFAWIGLAQTPPPLGALVDAGGYRVHLHCTGAGSPTVVVTGAGASFDWSLVQPAVSRFTRICTYDHSGSAWSDPGPLDTCRLRVNEIHTALNNAAITGPYVLVGHSLGALVSRLYAATHESDVAALVIVDHASAKPLLYRVGPIPPPPTAATVNANAGFEKLPERDYRLHLWATSLPSFPALMRRNLQMLPECEQDLATATQNRPTPLGDKPFIAVSTGASAQLHRDLLGLSTNSKQVTATNSGHYIMIDRPDTVIAAIQEAVEAVRKK